MKTIRLIHNLPRSGGTIISKSLGAQKDVILLSYCFSCCDTFIFNFCMNKIKLAVTGCLGRMGQQIIKSSKLDKKFKLVTLTENRKINRKISGIKPELNDENAFKKANIIIDFTIPKCTFQVLKIASKLKKK